MNLKRLRDLHSKCSMITVTSQTIMEHLIHIFSHLSFFLSLSVCLNQFPPIMTKENIFCTRFSDHVKMCCDSSTWAILLLFSKNESVFLALLKSMKYRDHFLISSQLSYFILHCTVVEPYKTTVSGLLSNIVIAFQFYPSLQNISWPPKKSYEITTFSPPDEQSNWLSF